MELTIEQKVKVTRLTSSFMGKLCFGGALALKGTGVVLEKGSEYAATGLRVAANGVEEAGKVSSSACYRGAQALARKGEECDISDLTDEQIAEALKD